MKEMKFFLVIFIITYCISALVGRRDDASKKNPHIILIVADDLGWNDVSFHGSDQVQTPNIDALAYNGVILNKHYVLPMCTPSRSALLTGRYPIRHGMQGWPLKAGEVRALPLHETLLPKYLKNIGYSTSLVGKWHLGYFSPNRTPTRRGFDHFFGYYNGLITYFDHWISQEIGNNSTVKYGQDVHEDTADGSLNATRRSGYFTDIITEEAVRVIRDHGNDKPLFLEISHLAIHASDDERNPLEVRNMTEVNATFHYIEDVKRRKCAGMIKALDDSVGEVIAALGEAGMLENSIIVFMSDNGAPTVGMYENAGSNYPLRGIKNEFYEGAVRGAAFVYSPLIEKSSRLSEQLMHVTDWVPTLYAAAGGDLADIQGVDGLNLWPHISRNAKSPRKSFLVNIDEKNNRSGAVLGKYKLIRNASGMGYHGESRLRDPSYPLYDLQEVMSSSPAGAAIGRFKIKKPKLDKIRRLREKSTLHCDENIDYANCTTICLFDLQADPCETRDLSVKLPKVVKKLDEIIENYKKVLEPQTSGSIDPQSYPENFDGFWMPWIKDTL